MEGRFELWLLLRYDAGTFLAMIDMPEKLLSGSDRMSAG